MDPDRSALASAGYIHRIRRINFDLPPSVTLATGKSGNERFDRTAAGESLSGKRLFKVYTSSQQGKITVKNIGFHGVFT